jgi:outer membrane protein W
MAATAALLAITAPATASAQSATDSATDSATGPELGPEIADPAAISTAPARRDTRFYFRGGVVLVAPLEISQDAQIKGIDGPASLALENGPVEGSGSSVDSAIVPGVIIGYVLPWWNRKVAVEVILGTPFEIELKSTGTLANESLAPEALGIATGVPPLGSELGTAKVAPPTITAVYRFDRKLGPIQPYAGTGVSVLFAYDETITNPILTAVRDPDFEIPPAPGLVLQGGLEARLFKRLYATVDVKFVAGMLVRGKVSNIVVETPELPLFENAEVGTAQMNVWVNPLIVQAGVGYDF